MAGPGLRWTVDTSVPARPEEIMAARAVVRQTVEGSLPQDRLDDLLIAVSEACTNAVEAQLMAGTPIPIDLRCECDGAAVVVEVEDQAGPGFDPRRLPSRPPVDAVTGLTRERGWGIELMRELVDELAFVPTPTGTIVRLSVALAGA